MSEVRTIDEHIDAWFDDRIIVLYYEGKFMTILSVVLRFWRLVVKVKVYVTPTAILLEFDS